MSDHNSRQIVTVRVRPTIKRETDDHVYWAATQENQILQVECGQSIYQFDRVIDPSGSNIDVYNAVARELVQGAIQGINGTIFAYGQTASGKTYTMLGSDTEKGLMIYALEELFQLVSEAKDRAFLISMEYKEIYNEEVNDLLSGVTNLKIRESEDGSVYVENCQQELVECARDFEKQLARGGRVRHVGATNMNERSSRSHAIATLRVESKLKEDDDDGAVLVSQLNFVDLAGSEKASQTGAVGQRLKEGSRINASLSALALCMSKLAENSPHIPYRDSKLTRLLQNSIGGNSKTAIVANITPASLEETISTLRFAARAKTVATKPIVNEVVDEHTLTKRLQKRVKELELKLAQRQRSSLDSDAKHKLLQELLKPAAVSEETLAKHRRMTWCAPKMAGPLLPRGEMEDTFDKDDIVDSGLGASSFTRPPPPSKVTLRRKRPMAERSSEFPTVEEEVFVEPHTVFKRKSEPQMEQMTVVDSLNSQLVRLKEENAALKHQATLICEVEKELAQTRKDLEDTLQRKAEVESSLAAAKDNSEHETALAAANKSRLEVEETLAQTRQDLEDALQREAEVESSQAAAKDNSELETALAAANKSRLEVEETLAQARQDLEDALQREAEVESSLAAAKDNSELETALATANKSRLEVEETLAQTRQDLEDALQRNGEVESSLAAAKDNSELETALAAANKSRLEAEETLAKTRQDLEDALQREAVVESSQVAAKDNSELETALAAANKSRQDVEETLAQTRQDLEDALQREAEVESSQAAAKDNSELETALATANNSRQDVEETLAQTSQYLEDALQRNGEVESSQAAAKDNSELETALAAANKSRLEVEATLTQTRQGLEDALQKNAEVESSLAAAKDNSEHETALAAANKSRQDVEETLAQATQYLKDALQRNGEVESSQAAAKDNSELETALAAANKSRQDVEETLAQTRQYLEDALQRNGEVESSQAAAKDNSELETALATANKSRLEVEETLAQTRQDLEDALQRNAEVESSQAAAKDNSELETALATANKSRLEVEETLAQARQDLEDALQRNAEVESSLAAAKDNSELETALATANKSRLEVEKTLAQTRQDLEDALQREAEVESSQAAAKDNSELETALAAANKSRLEVEKTLAQTRQDLEDALQRNAEVESSQAAAKDNSELETALAAANKSRLEVEETLAQARQDLEDALQREAEVESSLAAANDNSEIETALAAANKSRLEVEETLAQTRQDLEDALQRNGEVESSQAAAKDNSELETALAAANKSRLEVEETLAQTRQDLEDALERNAELESSLASAEKNLHLNTSCSVKRSDLEVSFAQSETGKAGLNMRVEELQTEVARLQKEKASLWTNLETSEERASKYDRIAQELETVKIERAELLLADNARGQSTEHMYMRSREDCNTTLPASTRLAQLERSNIHLAEKLTEQSTEINVWKERANAQAEMVKKGQHELDEVKKQLGLKDDRIATVEKHYETLSIEHEELQEFTEAEKAVYACRTPGQVKEIQLKRELRLAEDKHTKEAGHLTDQLVHLEAENLSLKQTAGVVKGADVLSETMPNYSSPSLGTPKLNRGQFNRPETNDVAINTDMDIRWFEMDDTILGVKTGAANSSMSSPHEQSSLPMPTPSKRLVLDELSEFKRGLQLTYETIAQLNEKQAESERVTAEAVRAAKQEVRAELTAQIDTKQQEIAELEAALATAMENKLDVEQAHAHMLQDLEHALQDKSVVEMSLATVKSNAEREASLAAASQSRVEEALAKALQDLEDALQREAEMESSLAAAKDNSELETALAAANKSRQEVEDTLAQIRQDLDDALQREAEVELSLVAAKDNSELETALAAANKIRQEVEETLAQTRQDLEDALQREAEVKSSLAAAKDNSELETALAAANKSRLEVEETLAQTRQDLEDALQREAEVESSLVAAKDNSELETALAAANKSRLEVEETLAQTRQDLEDALQREAEVESSLAAAKDNSELETALATANKSRLEVEETLTQTRQDLEDALQRKTRISTRLEAKQDEIVELRALIRDLKSEKASLEIKLQSPVYSPDQRVKLAEAMQEKFQDDSERYHDELVDMEDRFQKFGELYLGEGGWTLDTLLDGLSAHLPESLKEAAAASMNKPHPKGWRKLTPLVELPPLKPEQKGNLCPHLRKRQHSRIVALESDKAGLHCEIIKLNKQIKELQKLCPQMDELKQKHHKLKQEHMKLDDLFTRTEQDLYAAREKVSAAPTPPPPVANPGSRTRSSLFPVAEFDIHAQMKIKGLEYEKSSNSRKINELETTLDKLRVKYVVLREKYDRLNADRKDMSTSAQTLASSAIVNSPAKPKEEPKPIHGNVDLGLNETGECKQQ